MFKMIFSGCAYEALHCVDLRCECGASVEVDTDNFKEVEKNYVVLKNKVKVTCPKCGKSQPQNERFIIQEPQIIRTPAKTSQPKGLLRRFIESMADMSSDEILSVSNQVAAFNDDFSDSCD